MTLYVDAKFEWRSGLQISELNICRIYSKLKYSGLGKNRTDWVSLLCVCIMNKVMIEYISMPTYHIASAAHDLAINLELNIQQRSNNMYDLTGWYFLLDGSLECISPQKIWDLFLNGLVQTRIFCTRVGWLINLDETNINLIWRCFIVWNRSIGQLQVVYIDRLTWSLLHVCYSERFYLRSAIFPIVSSGFSLN